MIAEPPDLDVPHPADLDEEPMPEALAAPEPRRKSDPQAEGVKPPHSLEAEREVLSAVFIVGSVVCPQKEPKEPIDVSASLQPSDFYFERHQLVFGAMLTLHERGTAIDIVTVMQALKDHGQYEKIGGARALGELLDRAGTVTNLEHYIGIVRGKARLRDVVDTLRSIETQALQDVHDVDEFVATAKASTAAVMERVAKPAEPMLLDSIAERVAKGERNWLEEVPPDAPMLLRNPDGSPFMLDGRVGVLEAPGGTGKSWLVIQLAIATACGGKWLETYGCVRKGRVLLALGEEQDEEIWRRVWRVAKHLKLTEYEREEVARNLVPLGLDGEDVAFLRKSPDGNIVTTPWFDRLQHSLSRHEWRLGLLDPLSFFGGPEVEADPHVATQLIRCVSRLTKAPGNPAFVVSCHSRKKQLGQDARLDASNARGSSAITDGARWVCSMGKRSDSIIAIKATKTNYTVGGDELLLTRGVGGVLRPATPEEIASDLESRKEARVDKVKRARPVFESNAQRLGGDNTL